ncbi:MAG: UDP-N-acetylglucosamine 1-carboxyvinyltransferase [Clostridia bacterium]|nr:UDP-N-acetylglucosamine 1-carboxyvinyltransferase [Clostridia bacterium]
MSVLAIEGGRKLEGEIAVQGAKNAVLPILAATIMNGGKNTIYNCPKLRDVDKTIEVLEYLGCKVKRQENTLTVDSSSLKEFTIPEELMRQMRSSIIFLGAIVNTFGRATVSMPGGCEIGNRPIDLHLKALRQLGIEIKEEHGYIECSANVIKGANIHLDFPSVGATENIMLSSCRAKGTTTITNAAREPEIVDLQNFLNDMGAKISGAGGSVIQIDGVQTLHGTEHTIITDRIVAATYLACGAATGGSIVLKRVDPAHMEAMINVLKDMGCRLTSEKDKIILYPCKCLKEIPMLRTMPYPGFPTDTQSPFMTLAAIADGTSIFVETIFENRYKHVEELVRMGADIQVDGRVAVVRGVKKLSSANVSARDLRGGAALVVAGLAADGITRISNVEYIDRGYEDIEKYIGYLNGNIKRINC